MRFLLTNDDGHESPLLEFIIDFLSSRGELVIVVPKVQQSWKGKSITRYGEISLQKSELFGHQCYLFDGTPADCVNFGIYHLFDSKPDLVVSGINLGHNTGLSFLCSSGTVGACFEGNLAGVPGLALSQRLEQHVFNELSKGGSLTESHAQQLRVQSRMLLDRISAVVFQDADFLASPVTLNVNFPYIAGEDTPIRVVPVSQRFYRSLFKGDGLAYRHDMNSEEIMALPHGESDFDVVNEGSVSITELDLRVLGNHSGARTQQLQRRFEAV